MIIAAAETSAGPAASRLASPAAGSKRASALAAIALVVERTLAWLARFRRLAIRYERRVDLHLALTTLACALICKKQINRFCS